LISKKIFEELNSLIFPQDDHLSTFESKYWVTTQKRKCGERVRTANVT
jgi:hypothetical protein